MPMRLFIAIQFDENIRNALLDFQTGLKRKGVSGNYTRRGNTSGISFSKYAAMR